MKRLASFPEYVEYKVIMSQSFEQCYTLEFTGLKNTTYLSHIMNVFLSVVIPMQVISFAVSSAATITKEIEFIFFRIILHIVLDIKFQRKIILCTSHCPKKQCKL